MISHIEGNEEPRKEAPVAPEGSQDTSKNQHTVDQTGKQNQSDPEEKTSEKKTSRHPYDGSKSHGVRKDAKNITDIFEATRAMDRFKLRYEYLSKRYDEEAAKVQDPDLRMADRLNAKKKTVKISEQINELSELVEKVDGMFDGLEEKDRSKLDTFDPSKNKRTISFKR